MSDVVRHAAELLGADAVLLVLGATLGAILMWAALRRRWALLVACLVTSAAAAILYVAHASLPVLAAGIAVAGVAALLIGGAAARRLAAG